MTGASDASPDRPPEESPEEAVERDRVARRSELLPEEREAGSDDPVAQAEATLEESDERTEHPERSRHESTQTPDYPGQQDRS
jgi:hypothetical protein